MRVRAEGARAGPRLGRVPGSALALSYPRAPGFVGVASSSRYVYFTPILCGHRCTDLSSGSLVLTTTGQGWCVPLRPGWRSMAQGREGTCLRHWGGGGPGIETRLGGRAPAFPSAWAPDMDPRPRSSLRGRAGGGGVVSESAHVTAREHDPAKNKDRRSADPKSSSRGRWRAGPGGGQFYSNQGVVWPYAGPCSPQKGGARIVQKPEDTQRL